MLVEIGEKASYFPGTELPKEQDIYIHIYREREREKRQRERERKARER